MSRIRNILSLGCLLFLIFASCKKEDIEVADYTPLTSYDCVQPQNFFWNENGLYFSDFYIEQTDTSYGVRVFGFDQDANLKFKNAYNVNEMFSSSYTKKTLLQFNIETTGVLIGFGEIDTLINLHFQEFDIESGDKTDLHIIPFNYSAGQTITIKDLTLRETSTGYISICSYRASATSLVLRFYEFDKDFNILNSADYNFGNTDLLLRDVEILPNDEIVILYEIKLFASSLAYTLNMRKFGSDLSFKWSQNLSSSISASFLDNEKFNLHYLNESIVMFAVAYNISSGTNVGDPLPTFYNFNPTNGFYTSFNEINDTIPENNTGAARLMNAKYSFLSPSGELTICGSTSESGITNGISIELNSDFEVLDYFTISNVPPSTILHFSGFNSSGVRIISGVAPRYINANIPVIGQDDLNVFVGKVDENGAIIPE